MELNERQKGEVEEVIFGVCKYFGTEKDKLIEKSGEYLTYSNTRHFCWYILHYDMGVSIRLIANRFDRSQNSVNKGIAKIKFGIKSQSYYRDRYNDLVTRIKIPDLSLFAS